MNIIEMTKKKFKKSPKGNPIDFSGRSGIYEYSEWFSYEGYEGGGAWIHIYRDIEGEKARYAYLNAQASSEEREFNKKMA
jgi:hypothetical protein